MYKFCPSSFYMVIHIKRQGSDLKGRIQLLKPKYNCYPAAR